MNHRLVRSADVVAHVVLLVRKMLLVLLHLSQERSEFMIVPDIQKSDENYFRTVL